MIGNIACLALPVYLSWKHIMQHLKSSTESTQQLQQILRDCQAIAPEDYRAIRISELRSCNSSIAYYEFGDPHGAPLLCLHGLSVSGFYFGQFDAVLRAMGLRAIAPCLLGGVYQADATVTIDTLASRVLELMDSLSIAQFDVVGFSWGTLTELALMARAPERIGKAGFLGAMTPIAFVGQRQLDQLKGDVRLSLTMVRRVPRLHRSLMAMILKMPLEKMLDQFKDEHLSTRERQALEPGSAFRTDFVRSMGECIRTGGRFFTDGWRMCLDQPTYALDALPRRAASIETHLYVAEHDNVHLPWFSALIAASLTGIDVAEVDRRLQTSVSQPASVGNDGYYQVYARGQCSIWMMDGAGRIASVLYFEEALRNMMAHAPARQALAG